MMTLRRLAGLDILSEKYSYAYDPEQGYTAASRMAEKWIKTTCGYCSVGCGMQIGVREGQAVAVRGDINHPVNLGKLCPKGLSEHHTLNAKTRLRTPLLRKAGKLVPVSWDEALTVMLDRIGAVQRKYGSEALGVISTGQLVTEEFYTLGKLVQLGFGTRHYCGNTTLCMASAAAGYKRTFGSDGPPGSYEDLETAEVVILIGGNIADNHPILCRRLENNKTGTFIVVDPRVTKTAMMADIYLPIKPRADIALVNGIAHILIRENLVDHDYIARNTTGYEAFAAFVAKYTPEQTAAFTGLSVDQIEKVALLYGRAKSATISWTMGVNHSTQGAETVNAISNLSLMTGKLGQPGSSPFSITGQCNAMGTRETGFTSGLPGYRKFESQQDREDLAALWNIPVERIPSSRGLAYPDIIEATVKGSIKALWIIATNPVISFPNHDVLRQGLENLDFLVVQDGFHPTPTTELADLVLPAAIWGEKEGTYTNSERRCSKVNRAVAPPGEARPDFDIFLELAKRMGSYDELFPGWETPRDAFEEWKRVSAGRLCDYSHMSYESLEQFGGMQWGGARLYEEPMFSHEDGRAKFWAIENEPFPEQPSREFPFILNTGRTVEHWHTRTKTGEIAILHRMSPRAWLEMNPADASRLKLKPHDRASVISRRSRVDDVEVRITEIIAPGQVFLPFHFAETNSNRLTQSAFDPISREPNFKQCAVRVEKAVPVKTGVSAWKS